MLLACVCLVRLTRQNDKHLGRYLHIIRESPVYPVIYDSQRTVCSLPPIINGNHSKISLNTTNVFIELTATDLTKVEVVNNIMVAMFSQYTEDPFTYELTFAVVRALTGQD